MVRSKPRPRAAPFEQGPRLLAEWVPTISVVAASMLAILPIISQQGWWPDFGFLMLLAWRMRNASPFPNWYVIPLGLLNDLVALHPLGLSIVTFTMALIVIDVMDMRRLWKDYWTEWLVAALLIALTELIQWWVSAIHGAAMPIKAIWPPIIIMIFAFPIVSMIVGWLETYRSRK